MNRRQLMVYGGVGGVCCLAKRVEAAHDDTADQALWVEVDSILLAASGWDLPATLKDEIAQVRKKIAARLAQ